MKPYHKKTVNKPITYVRTYLFIFCLNKYHPLLKRKIEGEKKTEKYIIPERVQQEQQKNY